MLKPSGWLLCLALSTAPLWAAAELTALPNGDRYQGEVTDGVLNGPGTYVWADGDRYEGTFLFERFPTERALTRGQTGASTLVILCRVDAMVREN